MTFCVKCGNQVPDGASFCAGCGTNIQQVTQTAPTPAPAATPAEIAYFKGEGELIVKRTEHRGAGRKVASLAMGPVGYLAFGRDKTDKSKAKGMLVVTNKAIYCAGNAYPFDRIISLTKQGTISKSIVITFEQNVRAGGRAEGGLLGVGGLSLDVELKTNDIDALFRGLEQARMSGIQGL